MFKNNPLPFSLEDINNIRRSFPTPFYIYDEEGIRKTLTKLKDAFSWNIGFKEYFPLKANPNPSIIRILKEEGCGADCCSIPELTIAKQQNLTGENVILTAPNGVNPEEFKLAREMGTIINLDDPDHLTDLFELTDLPEVLSLRYNPGPFSEEWNELRDNKFGMKKDQLFDTYKKALSMDVRRFGLHMMIMSNDLNSDHLVETTRICFDLAIDLKRELGIDLEFIDLGGSLGIPYMPTQKEPNIYTISKNIKDIYYESVGRGNLKPPKIFLEFGRYILGQHGYLISKVNHIKETYKKYVGLDSSMAQLMRPGMYGSYHHISALKEDTDNTIEKYDIVGSLCENNDKFAIDRQLPKLNKGDLIVIHQVGTYGRSKVFDFNGKLRSAEFLLKQDGSYIQIRRAETIEDYMSTFTNNDINVKISH